MEKWSSFDNQLDMILDSTMRGDVDKKIRSMTSIVYNVGKELFGIKLSVPKEQTKKQNRRETQIQDIRKELKNLRKRYNEAPKEERPALSELRSFNREKLKSLRRAENHRRNKREKRQKRARFTSNPFRYVSSLLGVKRSGKLNKPKEEVEAYLRTT